MKRIVSLVLTLCLAFSIASVAWADYDGTAPLFDETKTISLFSTNGASSYYDFDNMSWMQELIRRANVKLDLELIDSSTYQDALMPRLAAGVDLPDIMAIQRFDEDMSIVNTGLFLDLTELIDTYGFNIQKRYEQVPTLRSQLTTPDGKIYYMPTIDTLIDVYGTAIMANRYWMEAVDAENPTTVEEFYQICKLFKESDPNGNGKDDEIPCYLELYYLKAMGSSWGIDLQNGFFVNEQGTIECSYASERYKNFLEYWKRMYEEGLLNADFATATWDSSINVMSNNMLGFYYRHHDNAVTWSKTIKPDYNENEESLILYAIEPLEGPYGDRFYWAGNVIGEPFAITKDCKDPLAAFAFLDWCYSEEANTLHFFGIEGEDYQIIDGKMVVDLERRNNNDFSYRMGNQFGGIPRVQEPIQRDITRPQQIIDTNALLKPYYRTPILKSFFLPEEAAVLQDYKTDFNTYVEEMMISYITGAKDLATFDSEYLNALKAMQVDKLIEVYQARYDRSVGK